MKAEDIQSYIDRYRERLHEFGYSPETLGWGKYGKQDVRFSVFSEHILKDPEASVLDIGCGFADLYGFLRAKGWKGKYTGIDLVPDLLMVAGENHPGLDLRAGDFVKIAGGLPNYDYVVASGIFNFMLEGESNEAHITNTLTLMFQHSNKLVIADFMTTYVDFKKEGAYHTDPVWLLQECYRITRRLQLRQDFMPFEFAILLFKDQALSERNVFQQYEQYLSQRG